MYKEYVPRFSFEISEEQQSRANKLLSVYGIKKAVFGVILDDLLDLLEVHGEFVIGVLLARATKPREILPSLAEAERKAEK